MSDGVRILVCRTCPRYEPAPPPGRDRRGRALGHLVRQRAGGHDVRIVNCLAGCKFPCNAALERPGSLRYRFSRLEDGDVAALIAFADRLAEGDDPGPDALPDGLRARLTALSPPRIGDG